MRAGRTGTGPGRGKAGLADLAAETGLAITCCHFPPGTSKWNKVEHRLFSQITMNWRGRPLTSHAVVLNSIAATTTATGLTVTAELDGGRYPTGTKVSDEQMTELEERALTRHRFRGAWNYTAQPPLQGPARPGPAATPSHAAQVTAALDCPALTGMSRRDLAALAAALQIPFNAAREQRLYAGRGGPRRVPGWAATPYRGTLGPAARLLATVLTQRLSVPQRVLAAIFGVHQSTISHAVTITRWLLTSRGITIEPAPARLRTIADFRHYARNAGVDLPATAKPTD